MIEIYVFKDTRNILIYFMNDLAFVPIEVIIVILIFNQLLSARERQAKISKLNMVIGAFFSEVGTELLKLFLKFDLSPERVKEKLLISDRWSDRDFVNTSKEILTYNYEIESQRGDITKLKEFLVNKRWFLLGLLENPNLLEHERFTSTLWAVFHLTEELCYRQELEGLPESDYAHLSNDIRRAYSLVIYEWIEYMRHLKDRYPYLFSLAVRTNPFNDNSSVVVK